MSYSMKDWMIGNARPNALHAPQATMNTSPSTKDWPLEAMSYIKIEALLNMSNPKTRELLLLDMCKSRATDYRLIAACHAETPIAGVALHLQDDSVESVRYAATTRLAAEGEDDEV